MLATRRHPAWPQPNAVSARARRIQRLTLGPPALRSEPAQDHCSITARGRYEPGPSTRSSDARGGARSANGGVTNETQSLSGIRIDDRGWGRYVDIPIVCPRNRVRYTRRILMAALQRPRQVASRPTSTGIVLTSRARRSACLKSVATSPVTQGVRVNRSGEFGDASPAATV